MKVLNNFKKVKIELKYQNKQITTRRRNKKKNKFFQFTADKLFLS